MMVTTKNLVDALTMALKNINQSPTISLFKGKKGEDLEDHILEVEDYFEIHEIKKEEDKISRFKDTLFETVTAKMGLMVREMRMVLLEIEDKPKETLEVHSVVEVKDEVGLIKVQMLDAQE